MIEWVSLSDLHFGATNSLLTCVTLADPDLGEAPADPLTEPEPREQHEGPMATPSQPSATLATLVPLLRALITEVNGDAPADRPTLILNGDVLDLSLAQDDVAGEAFRRFVELAFAPGRELFAPVIWYVPGNHDHHLWEEARSARYLARIRHSATPGGRVPRAPHVTSLQPDAVEGEAAFLSALIDLSFPESPPEATGRDGSGRPRIRVGYPNLAWPQSGPAHTVFHHGHFVDRSYVAISDVKGLVFPGAPPTRPPRTVGRLEAENYAWIDFVWGTLGRSGDVGGDVSLLYAMFQEPRATTALVIRTLFRARTLFRRRLARLLYCVVITVLMMLLSVVALGVGLAGRIGGLGRPERFRRQSELSPGAWHRLEAYLQDQVHHQMQTLERQVGAGSHPRLPTTFVFGHTHKPFEQRLDVTGQDVQIYNTGGWVIDTIKPSPTHGAALVLGVTATGDDPATPPGHDVASVRLFTQKPDGGVDDVRVTSLSDDPDLTEALRAALVVADDQRKAFTTAVANDAKQRREVLRAQIALGIRYGRG